MTAIAIPIFVKSGVDLEETIAQAEEVLAGAWPTESGTAEGAGMIELRCDTASARQMLEAIDLARVPVIVTVRPKWEGGQSDKTDEQRLALWEEAMDAGADYIDVELVAWEKSAKIRDGIEDAVEKAGTRLIISNHCFDGRPNDLEKRLERLRAVRAARVLKLAWRAESILDALDALRWTSDARKANRPLVALAMGEEGLLSRILAKKAGAPFTFATAEAGKESAPGQPTVSELLALYRWGVQRRDTPVYGVAGWPVGHSLSPHIHNAGFGQVGFGGVFVPLAIKPGLFAQAVDALRAALDLRGMSVTIPHKEAAFAYAVEHGAQVEELSRRLGVLNTLVWNGEQLKGLNTDYAGALDALVSAWTGDRDNVSGKRIAVMGAGGAARAIVASLVAHGATVVVYNRTREKADALVAEMGGRPGKVVAADWENLRDACCEAYVNCTPVGMWPKVDASPVDFDPHWGPETVVFDTVYNPLKTKLLKQAEKKGAKTVAGIEMFVRQAALQFREYTGKEADVEAFRRVVTGALKK